MCGLAGFVGAGVHAQGDAGTAILKRMTGAIAKRGPDDEGFWTDVRHGVFLGHRRLSILDLSPAGHQPMTSRSGRFVMAFNGEIYNHLELRADLTKSHGMDQWRGHSDTETLLASFDCLGVDQTLQRSVGMFAFALFDKVSGTITLGRDRLGEKPLYYGWQGAGENRCFLFASELKAIKAHPLFAGAINRQAVALLMRHNYVPAPHSIYTGIYKLQPGSLLTVSQHQQQPAIASYWSGIDVATAGAARPFEGTYNEAESELERLLRQSVRQQMVSDVPLGAFLSGGIDSSTIVALMQAQARTPVRTFTIGFTEAQFDEARYAKQIARHLGTDHTELYLRPADALKVIPDLPSIYCEPFSDSSQLPTCLVSRLARQQVTVALSGDGGDELFAGYNRYVLATKLWGGLSRVPATVRSGLGRLIRAFPAQRWDQVASGLGPFSPARQHQRFGDKLHKGAEILGSASFGQLYSGLTSHWSSRELMATGENPPTSGEERAAQLASLCAVQQMMALDLVTYLPDDILTKVDRAAMSVSLEGRMPFLDHRVVEFAWRLPQAFKLREGKGKWILRQVLYKYIPRTLLDRPKMGFGVPIGDWLRGPLREWASELLDDKRLRREGFFNAPLIRTKWDEHLSGLRNWEHHLWDVLMFQAWLDQNP